MRAEDAAKYGLIWLKPAPMNNTYGFAITKETDEKLKLEKLSDLRRSRWTSGRSVSRPS